MAFTETEKVTLSEILGITPLALTQHLEYVEAGLTTEAEDAIQADITYWNANLRNVAAVSIHPTESNRGAAINGDTVEGKLIRRIANWLSYDLSYLTSPYYVRTERS